MRNFNYLLTLASGFMPNAPAGAQARNRTESAPTGDVPRAPQKLRPAPTAGSRLPAARTGH